MKRFGSSQQPSKRTVGPVGRDEWLRAAWRLMVRPTTRCSATGVSADETGTQHLTYVALLLGS
jgi:hypothetical protein